MKRTLSVILAIIMVTIGLIVFMPKPTPASAGSSPSPASSRESSYFKEDALTESNQSTLIANQPAKTVTHSLERDNLNKRIEFTNNANQLGYVYILSDMGSVIGNYTIKGKVSSLNSMITQTEQIKCINPTNYTSSTDAYQCAAVDSPDLDGSYGNNPEGIFFFTTEGAYVEWAGKYLYSTQSMNINTPVTLTRDVK